MIEPLYPLRDVVRGLMLRSPEGPRTASSPVPVPPDLQAPERLPDSENGYAALAAIVQDWPFEGRVEPDLLHRLKALPSDRAAAERALAPLRPVLDRVDSVLAMPRWQTNVGEKSEWPELRPIRRLVHALLLRGALEGSANDRDRALAIAQHLRTAQSPMLHFLVGLALEKSARGSFENLTEERTQTVRWELARVILPKAHERGPWEPSTTPLPPNWRDDRRATQWVLAGNPQPYNPDATMAALLKERELLERGSSADLRARADELGAAWPPAMRTLLSGRVGYVPVARLRAARARLGATPNAYGHLSLARTLNAFAHMAAAVEGANA